MRMREVKFMFIQGLWLHFVHLNMVFLGLKLGPSKMSVAKLSDKIHLGHTTRKSVSGVSY